MPERCGLQEAQRRPWIPRTTALDSYPGDGISPGMPDETTTIEILKSDRDRLDELRRYPDEPYLIIVRRLLEQIEDPEPLSPETLASIQASLDEIQQGEFLTHGELKRDLEERDPTHNHAFIPYNDP